MSSSEWEVYSRDIMTEAISIAATSGSYGEANATYCKKTQMLGRTVKGRAVSLPPEAAFIKEHKKFRAWLLGNALNDVQERMENKVRTVSLTIENANVYMYAFNVRLDDRFYVVRSGRKEVMAFSSWFSWAMSDWDDAMRSLDDSHEITHLGRALYLAWLAKDCVHELDPADVGICLARGELVKWSV